MSAGLLLAAEVAVIDEEDGEGAMGCKEIPHALVLVIGRWKHFSVVSLDGEPAVIDLEGDTAAATNSEELSKHQDGLLQTNHMAVLPIRLELI